MKPVLPMHEKDSLRVLLFAQPCRLFQPQPPPEVTDILKSRERRWLGPMLRDGRNGDVVRNCQYLTLGVGLKGPFLGADCSKNKCPSA